jgi:hypothetical protein
MGWIILILLGLGLAVSPQIFGDRLTIAPLVTRVIGAVPEDAADGAVILTVEGWRIPLELRALVQVEPNNAPRVVASVGNLIEVEDKIITPAIRSIVRNETGREPDPAQGIEGTRVMDLITNRNDRDVMPLGGTGRSARSSSVRWSAPSSPRASRPGSPSRRCASPIR